MKYDIELVNFILQDISFQAAHKTINNYIDWLEEQEMLAHEDMMQTYACHSYDLDAIHYGMR